MDFEFEIEYSVKTKRGKFFRNVPLKNPLPTQITEKTAEFKNRVIKVFQLVDLYKMNFPCSEIYIKGEDSLIEDQNYNIVSGSYFSLDINIVENHFCITYIYTDDNNNIHQSVWTQKKDK